MKVLQSGVARNILTGHGMENIRKTTNFIMLPPFFSNQKSCKHIEYCQAETIIILAT
jgi:hypothetical protein